MDEGINIMTFTCAVARLKHNNYFTHKNVIFKLLCITFLNQTLIFFTHKTLVLHKFSYKDVEHSVVILLVTVIYNRYDFEPPHS
jgi:hypothetical protein